MHILVVCYEYPPVGGGGGRVVEGLARQLVLDGHRVDILTSGWRSLPARTEACGVTVHRIATPRARVEETKVAELAAYVRAMLPALRRLVKSTAYDLCNLHFIFPDGVVAPVLRRWFDGPVVITAHGSDVPGYNPERFGLLHRLLAPLWRRTVKAADVIVCPSPTLERLVRAASLSAPTVVIPNGFDPGRFEPQSVRDPRILVVTRLLRRKGVQHLLQAFAALDSAYDLVVVGDGPQREELMTFARESGGNVLFRGWLDNDSAEIKSLYERAAIFALPSSAENFPVSLLEAMAGGAAIVTTRGTGCEDVVGDTALLVSPGDVEGLRVALQRLTSDEALRDSLARAARDRMERCFAWPKVSSRYTEVFAELIGRHAMDRGTR